MFGWFWIALGALWMAKGLASLADGEGSDYWGDVSAR